MDETELITSKGRGVWGGTKYDLRLLTSSRTYSDSLHQASKRLFARLPDNQKICLRTMKFGEKSLAFMHNPKGPTDYYIDCLELVLLCKRPNHG